MGLLQKLKSVLGLDGAGSSESGRSGDVDVTVEREPSTADEDAVKGTETASSAAAAEPEDSEPADDTGSEEPALDEFETLAEADDAEADEDAEPPEVTDAAEDADTAEATEAADEADAAETTEADAETSETTDAEETEKPAESDADAADGSSDPVTELNGIGPAYGDRLAGVGIETVGDLATADAAEVADRIDLGESRVAGWIEQASDY